MEVLQRVEYVVLDGVQGCELVVRDDDEDCCGLEREKMDGNKRGGKEKAGKKGQAQRIRFGASPCSSAV